MPTSVVVTVLVAAVSVWVAPALTRQWDDRQKARELRVAITEDVIVIGTQAIYAAKAPRPGYKPAGDYDALLAQWYQQTAVLEAKLRAYFPKHIADQWARFSSAYVEQAFYLAQLHLPDAQKRHVGETAKQIRRQFERLRDLPENEIAGLDEGGFADLILYSFVFEIATGTVEPQKPVDERADILLEGLASTLDTTPAKSEETVAQAEELMVEIRTVGVRELRSLTDQLLSAHMTGFSTTRGDFLRDLLP
ncbi:MAG TPA: hypothetical protein VFM13_13670 [Gaiellaceae bacterium]|nr:hypothetical protein [Gaiellaceae bacterium]